MSRYGYLEVFKRVPWNSRQRESTVLKKKKGLNKLRFTNFKCILEVYSMEGLLLESDMYVKFKFASYMEFRHFIQGLK